MSDLNVALLLVQLFNFAVLIIWVVLVVKALKRSSSVQLSEGPRLIWVLIILLIPVLGAIAFLRSFPTTSPSKAIKA